MARNVGAFSTLFVDNGSLKLISSGAGVPFIVFYLSIFDRNHFIRKLSKNILDSGCLSLSAISKVVENS